MVTIYDIFYFCLETSSSFIEINECLNSPCEQVCTNIRGDYACSCKKGFRKIFDKTLGDLHSPRCESIIYSFKNQILKS